MLDTYNQAVHEDVACTIRTNINKANHHFIMEKIEVVGRKHKGQSGVVYGENGIAPTITTNKGDGQLLAEPIIGALRGRNPENPSERGRSNGKYKQRLELNENHTSNTITSVQKDNVVVEPIVLGWSRDKKGNVVDRHPVDVANCVTAAKRDNTQNFVVEPTIVQRGHGFNSGGEFTETSPTITGSTWHFNNILREQYRIRKLTERECLRLMGVSEEDIDKLIYHSGFTVWNGKKYVQVPRISKSRLYKLAGNSIVVDVMVGIFEQLLIGNKNTNQQLEIF